MKKCRKVKISAFLCWNATVTVQWGTIKLPLEYLVITIAKKNPFISAKISGNKSEEWQEIYSLKVPRIYSEYIMRKIRTVNKSGRQSWPNWSWRGCTVTCDNRFCALAQMPNLSGYEKTWDKLMSQNLL